MDYGINNNNNNNNNNKQPPEPYFPSSVTSCCNEGDSSSSNFMVYDSPPPPPPSTSSLIKISTNQPLPLLPTSQLTNQLHILKSQENHNQFQFYKDLNNFNYQNNNENLDNKILNVNFSEFHISPKKASFIFESWIKSLWFTPTGFKKLIDSNLLKKVYIPFYSFKINYNVEFSGFVTHDSKLNLDYSFEKERQKQQQQQEKEQSNNNNLNSILTKDGEINTNNNNNLPINFEQLIKDKNIKWNKVDGYITRTVNKILLLACNSLNTLQSNNGGGGEDKETSYNQLNYDQNIMNCINVQHFDFNDMIEKSFDDFKLFSEMEHVDIQGRHEPDIVWKKDYLNYLLEKEQSMSIEYLKQQENSKFVKNVSSNVLFNDKMVSLIYIPFYYTCYQYQSQSFSFFLNAQNSLISATRPEIGLGKLGDVLKYTQNYFSTLFNQFEPFSKTKGDELSIIDQTKVYNDSNYFLCFTRSCTNLFSGSSIGYFIIVNNSKTTPATLRGQKRRSVIKGNSFTLLPSAERTFSFKGHWTIEILDGEVNSINIIHINPREGGNNFQSIKN